MPETTTDPQGQSAQTTTVPSISGEGQTKAQIGETQEELPEQFKGKSASEIAKSYLELQRKLGEQSAEVHASRDQIQQWQTLGKVIQGNPALYKAIETEIEQISGKKPDTRATGKDDSTPERDDTRVSVENDYINRFESKYGIDRLPSEDKKQMHQRIGNELAEMFDPGGSKSTADIIKMISLQKLPGALEKAYKLATLDDQKEQARLKGLVQGRTNSEATFGNIPSSGVKGESNSLTPEEKKVARRLNISEDKYLKQKEEILKERS